MKKWITGTVLACTILSTATFPISAKRPFDGMRLKNWIAYLNQHITTKPSLPQVHKPEANTPQTPTTPNIQENTYAKAVLDLVNTERAKQGLNPLSLDEKLNNVAYAHSKDMADNNFFSHTNLKGQSPFDRMKNAGISYRAAAENIAAGQKTPEQVVKSWMNSDGHRKNILNGSFNKMGLGYYKTQGGYGTYWTQVFTD